MLGRTAYQDPAILLQVDRRFFGEEPPAESPFAAIEAFEPYLEARLVEGVRLHQITRHVLGLFARRPGARLFRRHLAEEASQPGAGLAVLRAAVRHVRRDDACAEAA
jgi:tRNA-dihydrouridine synthase A